MPCVIEVSAFRPVPSHSEHLIQTGSDECAGTHPRSQSRHNRTVLTDSCPTITPQISRETGLSDSRAAITTITRRRFAHPSLPHHVQSVLATVAPMTIVSRHPSHIGPSHSCVSTMSCIGHTIYTCPLERDSHRVNQTCHEAVTELTDHMASKELPPPSRSRAQG